MLYSGSLDFTNRRLHIKFSESDIVLDSSDFGNKIIITKTHRVRPVLVILCNSETNTKSIYSEIPENRIPKTITEFENQLFDLDLHLGIWFDICSNTMYLARDIFGITPVFYSYSQSSFHFSSHLNSLLSITEQGSVINNQAIVNYLQSFTPTFGYDLTFFQNIKRLSPGYYIKVDNQSFSLLPYNRFNPKKYKIYNGTITQYGAVLKELLIDSLKRNTDVDSSIGLFLSGGMDSSSLSSLMRFIYPQKRLNTYFFDTGSVNNSDRPYVDDVVSHINSVHKIVKPDFTNLSFLEEQIKNLAEPPVSVSGGLPSRSVREAAKEDGISFLLTGHCGDNIIDHGYRYLGDVFEGRHWKELEEIQHNVVKYISKSYDHQAFNHLNDSNLFFNNVIYRQLSSKKNIRLLFKTLYSIGRTDTVFYVMNMLAKDILAKLQRLYFRDNSLVRKELLIYNTDFHGVRVPETFYLNKAISTKEFLVTGEMENINQLHNTKIRFPFLNKELFELSLAVPVQLKYNNGLTRGTLREAMVGILPQSINHRVTKHIFADNVKDFSRSFYLYYADYLANDSPIWDFVDKKPFFNALSRVEQSKMDDNALGIYSLNIFKTVTLSIWLYHFLKKI